MNILSDLPCTDIAEGIAARIQPGEGDKVLWLHGYTIDSRIWGDLWRRLPGWYHIGIDLPGHGASAPIDSAGNLSTLGHRLGDLCLEQDIRHIVALSFGTIIATQIAIAFPTSFTTLILSAPALAGGPVEDGVAPVYNKLYQLYHDVGPGPQMREVWMGSRVWSGIENTEGLYESVASSIDRHSWAEMAQFSMMSLLHPPQKSAALKQIQAATLVLIGDRELPAFRTVAHTLRHTLPRCQLLELADADHPCLLQQPKAAAIAIETHLRTYSGCPR